MLTARPNQYVLGQIQDSGRAPVSVSVLTPSLNRDWFSKHLHIRCFWSPAPAWAVPCTPMLVVTSVSECLVDHLLHGTCPNAMTFREPTMNGGWPKTGGNDKEGAVKQGVFLLLGDKPAHR